MFLPSQRLPCVWHALPLSTQCDVRGFLVSSKEPLYQNPIYAEILQLSCQVCTWNNILSPPPPVTLSCYCDQVGQIKRFFSASLDSDKVNPIIIGWHSACLICSSVFDCEPCISHSKTAFCSGLAHLYCALSQFGSCSMGSFFGALPWRCTAGPLRWDEFRAILLWRVIQENFCVLINCH